MLCHLLPSSVSLLWGLRLTYPGRSYANRISVLQGMDFDAMREVDLGKVLETECSQSSTHFDVHRHYCTPSGLDVVRLDTCSID